MRADSINTLLIKLKEVAIKNGDGIFGDLDQAVKDIEDCIESMDKSKISSLVAPTANLQDLSVDAGWGNEFLNLASKIEQSS